MWQPLDCQARPRTYAIFVRVSLVTGNFPDCSVVVVAAAASPPPQAATLVIPAIDSFFNSRKANRLGDKVRRKIETTTNTIFRIW